MRTLGRWREFSTRIALGAGLGRMMRQVLVEHFLLAGVAGAIGWGITNWSVRAWARATETRYLVLDYSVNADTFIYVLVISGMSAILISVVPIGRCVQLGLAGTFRSDPRGMTPGRRGKHLAASLVAVQVALAIVLLLGAGVLVRSFTKIVTADTGVRDADHLLVGFAGLPSDKYKDSAAWIAYFDRLTARLKAIPGVDTASVSSTMPTRSVNRQSVEIEGRPRLSPSGEFTQLLAAGPDYFRLMGVTAMSGREFNDGDHAASPLVAIVNQRFATHFWPGEPPIGKRLRTFIRDVPGPWRTVIAVAPNIMQGDATRQVFQPVVYVPFWQQPRQAEFFFVRTARPRNEMVNVVRAEVQTLDPDVTLIDDIAPLQTRFAFDRDWMDLEHSELGKHAAVAPIFAVIALVLAATGLVAVVAHSVSLRTKEIGIRMAIGAAATDVRRMVFREGMWPVAVGLMIGLGASLAVNRILQSQLVGVSPYDPVTMGVAPMILIVVALLACTIPARRAVNVDPVIALRQD
jgi:putative ABC transport system permease protein